MFKLLKGIYDFYVRIIRKIYIFCLINLFYEFIACNRICCTVIMLVLNYFEWKKLNRIFFGNIRLFVDYFGKLTSLINLPCRMDYLGLPHQLSLIMISPLTAFLWFWKDCWLNLLVKTLLVDWQNSEEINRFFDSKLQNDQRRKCKDMYETELV